MMSGKFPLALVLFAACHRAPPAPPCRPVQHYVGCHVACRPPNLESHIDLAMPVVHCLALEASVEVGDCEYLSMWTMRRPRAVLPPYCFFSDAFAPSFD